MEIKRLREIDGASSDFTSPKEIKIVIGPKGSQKKYAEGTKLPTRIVAAYKNGTVKRITKITTVTETLQHLRKRSEVRI